MERVVATGSVDTAALPDWAGIVVAVVGAETAAR